MSIYIYVNDKAIYRNYYEHFVVYGGGVKTAFPYRYILKLPTFEYCLMGLNIKEGTRQRQEALMSNHCLICHR